MWSAQNKFQKWLDIEIAACWAHASMGNIPQSAYETIKAKATFQVNRIEEIEAEIQHDVIAFLTNVAEHVGEESRFVHLGLTSTDVVDTALSLVIQDAGKILIDGINGTLDSLKKLAHTHKTTMMMGRTHGVHAEPTSFGLKVTVWYAEMQRNLKRLEMALADLKVGKISGAVGNYAHLSPEIERLVCEKLGLEASPISTQILQRDRHAAFISAIAITGGTLEKISTEIRALQKTEFNEVQEPFSSSQKGSSAMPHKRNPIICERITGLSRVLRGYALTAFENQNLWHERDISHSGAERVILPDACGFLDYMMALMQKTLNGLVVNSDQMAKNILASRNVFYSQQLLLVLVNKGMSREEAYRLVQKNALAAFDTNVLFDEMIRRDEQITSLVSDIEISEIFSLKKYQSNIDLIYERVYGVKSG